MPSSPQYMRWSTAHAATRKVLDIDIGVIPSDQLSMFETFQARRARTRRRANIPRDFGFPIGFTFSVCRSDFRGKQYLIRAKAAGRSINSPSFR